MLESKQRQITDAEKLPIPTVQAIIDGKLTGALSGKTLEVVSPIDGKMIAAIPDCEAADVDRAVAGARRAFADAIRLYIAIRYQKLQIRHCTSKLVRLRLA